MKIEKRVFQLEKRMFQMGKRAVAFLLCAAMLLLFAGCNSANLGSMKFALNEDEQGYTLTRYKNSASQTVLTIPDTFEGKPVTAIGGMAIQNCDDLLKIEIGANLTEIDKWGVFGCRYLKEFAVREDNPAFCAVDGVLFSKDGTCLVSYPNANTAEYDKGGALKEEVSYAVPEGVTEIAHAAFYKCYALKEVTLPGSLRLIGIRAFHGCQNLKQLALPEGLETIRNDAFLKCLGLTEITIPATVRKIGNYAFYSGDNLESVTILAPKAQLTQGHRWLPEPGRKPVEPVWGNEKEVSLCAPRFLEDCCFYPEASWFPFTMCATRFADKSSVIQASVRRR